MFGQKTKIVFISAILISILIAGFYLWHNNNSRVALQTAEASSSDNVSGFAWSENIGWISFNNTSGGGSTSYGVNINSATGLFSGYAWSENIGWIDFAPVGPYPSAPNYSAKTDLINGNVSGWARALANGGGWDGWIKLRKDASDAGADYGVSINKTTGVFSGWAWGSDVIGWISFNSANCDQDSNGFIDSGICGGDNKTTPIMTYGTKVDPGIFNNPPSILSGSLQSTALASVYCGVNPSQRFSWTFSDPDSGDTQSAYWLQVDTNSDFSSPEFDSGKVTSSSQERFIPVSLTAGPNQLVYNVSYYWRVQVYDNKDASSGWQNASLTRTPLHQYPSVNFTWTPQKPSINQMVNFQDQTVFHVLNQINRSWLWTMPAGSVYAYQSGTNQNSQNPKVKFTNFGNKTIILNATDLELKNDPYSGSGSCQQTNLGLNKPFLAGLPLPKFQEIPPF